jgi:hypothetical protein
MPPFAAANFTNHVPQRPSARARAAALVGGRRAGKLAAMQQPGEARPEIYTYESANLVYSCGWSVSDRVSF